MSGQLDNVRAAAASSSGPLPTGMANAQHPRTGVPDQLRSFRFAVHDPRRLRFVKPLSALTARNRLMKEAGSRPNCGRSLWTSSLNVNAVPIDGEPHLSFHKSEAKRS